MKSIEIIKKSNEIIDKVNRKTTKYMIYNIVFIDNDTVDILYYDILEFHRKNDTIGVFLNMRMKRNENEQSTGELSRTQFESIKNIIFNS